MNLDLTGYFLNLGDISTVPFSTLATDWLKDVDFSYSKQKVISYEKSIDWFVQCRQLYLLSEELEKYIQRLKIGNIYPIKIYKNIQKHSTEEKSSLSVCLVTYNRILEALFVYECYFYEKSFIVKFKYTRDDEMYTGFVCGKFDPRTRNLSIDYGGSESDFYKYLGKIPVITSPSHKSFNPDLVFLKHWVYRHFVMFMTTYNLFENK